MRKFIIDFKKTLETQMLRIPTGREAAGWWCLVAAMLGLAYWVMSTMASTAVAFDLFLFPIITAVFFFKRRGMLVIPPAIVMYCLGLQKIAGHMPLPEQPLFQYISSGFFQAAEWVTVSLVAIFAMRRFARSRSNEAEFGKDLAMARKLQMALLPKNYDMGTVRIAGKIQQCKEIGGDYYYFRPFQNTKVVFCLGDVMGKGIPSSMVTSIIMGFVYEWGKKSSSPADVLSKLNERLVDLWDEGTFYFTTIFYAIYDEETRVLTYASGGHHAAVLLHSDGQTEFLHAEGGLVGAIDIMTWSEKQVSLAPGDRVIVFTDGVTEALSPSGDMFSMENAVRCVSQNYKLGNTALLDRLFEAVSEYTDGVFSDDVAVLVMEVKD